MPSARTVITVAIISALTYFAIEAVQARGGVRATTRTGVSRLRGVA